MCSWMIRNRPGQQLSEGLALPAVSPPNKTANKPKPQYLDPWRPCPSQPHSAEPVYSVSGWIKPDQTFTSWLTLSSQLHNVRVAYLLKYYSCCSFLRKYCLSWWRCGQPLGCFSKEVMNPFGGQGFSLVGWMHRSKEVMECHTHSQGRMRYLPHPVFPTPTQHIDAASL